MGAGGRVSGGAVHTKSMARRAAHNMIKVQSLMNYAALQQTSLLKAARS